MLSNCISKSLDCGMYFLTLPQTCAMKFQLKKSEPSTSSLWSPIFDNIFFVFWGMLGDHFGVYYGCEFDLFPDVV